jgi:hypothetical protein
MSDIVIDLLLDQVMILATGRSNVAALDQLDMIKLVDVSMLFHDFSVYLNDAATAQDLDATSEADTEAGDEFGAD